MPNYRLIPAIVVLASLPALAACSGGAQRMQQPAAAPSSTMAAPAGQVSSQSLPPPTGQTNGQTPMDGQQQMAALPQPTEPPTRENVLGQWQLSGAGDSCQVFVALTSWEGGYRASTRGCSSPELTNVGAWNIENNLVVLKDNAGNPVARMTKSGPTRFDGRLELGGAVSMSR